MTADSINGNPDRVVTNPLSTRAMLTVHANSRFAGEQCPAPDCDKTVDCVDTTSEHRWLIVHEGDVITDPRYAFGDDEADEGCRVVPDTEAFAYAD